MKLVLLPGMDGTGHLFNRVIAELNVECLIVSYPENISQDHHSLSKHVLSELPDEDIIILAESFAGGIVPHLLRSHCQIKGVCFVASFLSCPRPSLVRLARYLPLKKLARLPFTNSIYKQFFLGNSASEALIEDFKSVISSLAQSTIDERLETIFMLRKLEDRYDVPTMYIEATNDKLVPTSKGDEILSYFNQSERVSIAGPHFILQSKPRESADFISRFFQRVQQNS